MDDFTVYCITLCDHCPNKKTLKHKRRHVHPELLRSCSRYSPLSWCAPDASWMHCFIFQRDRFAFTKTKRKRNKTCKQKSCAQKCCSVIGETVWWVKRKILHNFYFSLQNIMEHRQVIFMLVLICSAHQQTPADGAYDGMVRQRVLTLNRPNLILGYVCFIKDLLQ